MRKLTPADILFYLILVAIVFMLVRPGGNAAEALIATTTAFAAVLTAGEGQPKKAG